MRLAILAFLLAASVSLHAASFEISGITIDLTGYTERAEPSTNQIAQKRALRDDGKVTFAGGKFRHPNGNAMQHAVGVLAIACADLAEFEKHARVLNIPALQLGIFFQKVREAQKSEGESALKVTLFRKVRVGSREGFQLNNQNTRDGGGSQTFFITGADPSEVVQLTFQSRGKELDEAEAVLPLLKAP